MRKPSEKDSWDYFFTLDLPPLNQKRHAKAKYQHIIYKMVPKGAHGNPFLVRCYLRKI